MNALVKYTLTASLAYTIHYSTSKLYSYFCIPDGILGFLQGFLTSGSPVCSLAFSVMSNTHSTYSTIIITTLSRAFVDVLGGITKDKNG